MRPRQILPGATYLVTRRCTQRQFLLTPTTRRHVETFFFCLAYAAGRTGIQVHAVVVMGNHYHLVLTDPHGVLPVFAECLNKLVAKCMNAMRGRWENFWASEPVSYVRLLDDEAVVDKIAYTMCNPVQEGLVKRATIGRDCASDARESTEFADRKCSSARREQCRRGLNSRSPPRLWEDCPGARRDVTSTRQSPRGKTQNAIECSPPGERFLVGAL